MIKNLNAKICFKILNENKKAKLIDVRTSDEWANDGCPDITSINKQVYFITWGEENFSKKILECNFCDEDTLLFICRSGIRSLKAIECLLDCFKPDKLCNVNGGMENGWKIAGLPVKYSKDIT